MPNDLVSNNKPDNLKVQIYGKFNDTSKEIITDYLGNLVNLPLSAFKDLRTIDLQPVTGWTFNYNINAYLIKTSQTGLGTITQADCMAILSTTSAINSSAKIETRKVLRYSPGLGALVRFTAVFTKGVAGSSQLIGLGDDLDGFFFGYNGSNFGVMRRQNGSDTWTYQADWNTDKMDGKGVSGINLDATKGNVYSIRYQWLGFGLISFYIENPVTGDFQLVHTIQYANANVVPSVYNPSFPIMAKVINTSNNTNIQLKTPSAMGFVEGNALNKAITTRNCIYSNEKTVTTEASIISIRNADTFQGKLNKVRVQPDFSSISVKGNNPVVIKVIKNCTLGGTPVWIDINSNYSVIQYDVSATTVSNGILIAVIEIDANGSQNFIVSEMELFLNPGDMVTYTASSSSSSQVFLSVTWIEYW